MTDITTLNCVAFVVSIGLVDGDASIVDGEFKFARFDVLPALGTDAMDITPVIMLRQACGFFSLFWLDRLSKAKNIKVLRDLA